MIRHRAMLPAIAITIVVVLLSGGFKRRVRHGPDGGRCDLHGVALQPDSVPIIYGCVFPERKIALAEEEEFPNANEACSGGPSFPGPDSPRLAATMYCPECRRAAWTIRTEWHRWSLRESKNQRSDNR